MEKNYRESETFGSIKHTIDKSTIFHSMGANELIGQLNAMFINHESYINRDDRLNDTDKAGMINETTYLILDALNCISALGEIYNEIEKYKIITKK